MQTGVLGMLLESDAGGFIPRQLDANRDDVVDVGDLETLGKERQ